MFCPKCGHDNPQENKFCKDCGSPLAPIASPAPAAVTGERRSFLVAILLSIFTGYLGVDRFYMGYIGLGILKLITAGGCGIWWFVDLILIATKNLKDADGKELEGT